MFSKLRILVIFIFACICSSVYAGEQVVIGERISLYSEHSKEDRPRRIGALDGDGLRRHRRPVHLAGQGEVASGSGASGAPECYNNRRS